ncbi:uncharacterized protein BP5553_06827 [Venustampulla echinocandica]|uniref:Uncharacterized protein n=1 Tax=Venustampulla echinocandica TaxID=2656787 RepID=A0A370TL27_9HELO|nr:uncharacterized protein BP5553_06827 [Venustampulla echinocandica]RDL36215.1 hypothetical protein BP5553_06827 [Venustampulla echinocandica]
MAGQKPAPRPKGTNVGFGKENVKPGRPTTEESAQARKDRLARRVATRDMARKKQQQPAPAAAPSKVVMLSREEIIARTTAVFDVAMEEARKRGPPANRPSGISPSVAMAALEEIERERASEESGDDSDVLSKEDKIARTRSVSDAAMEKPTAPAATQPKEFGPDIIRAAIGKKANELSAEEINALTKAMFDAATEKAWKMAPTANRPPGTSPDVAMAALEEIERELTWSDSEDDS